MDNRVQTQQEETMNWKGILKQLLEQLWGKEALHVVTADRKLNIILQLIQAIQMKKHLNLQNIWTAINKAQQEGFMYEWRKNYQSSIESWSHSPRPD